MRQRRSTIITLAVLLIAVPVIALAQAPTSLTLNPTTVQGGQSSTGQVGLSGPAPAGGLAVDLSSSNAAVATVPAKADVSAGVTALGFTVTTFPVAKTTDVTIKATAGGANLTVQLTVLPPGLTAVTITPPSSIGAGVSVMVTGKVTLNGPAPSAGLAVALSSSNTAAATVPASVTVPAGATTHSFKVNTNPVAQSAAVTITATAGGVSRTGLLTVMPAIPVQVDLEPPFLVGGQNSTGEVDLNGPAPSGGLVVQLSSNAPAAAAVPASVTVAAGARKKTFAATTSPVAQSTTVTITASAGGVAETRNLTVHPPKPSSVTFAPNPVTGGSSSTGQVSLNGPAPSGGLAVNLSSAAPAVAAVPASVTVAAGATTKSFAVTTISVPNPVVVPITATGGSGTKTASLTILPPVLSSVTLTPSSVSGSQGSTGQVSLNGPAPAGGRVVDLSSSNPAVAIVPEHVTVTAGATTKSFAVPTSGFLVTQSTDVTITASAGGVSRTANLTVKP